MESSVLSSPDHHFQLNIEEGYLDISINESDLELLPNNEELKSYVLNGTTDASVKILKLLSDEEINNFVLQKYCNMGDAFDDKNNLVHQYTNVEATSRKNKHARRMTPILSAKQSTKPRVQSQSCGKIPSPPRDSVKNQALHRIFNKKMKSSKMLKSASSKISFARENPKTICADLCPAVDYNRLMMTATSKLSPQLDRLETNFKIPKKHIVEYKGTNSLSASLKKLTILESSDFSSSLNSSSSSSTSSSGSSNSQRSRSSFKRDDSYKNNDRRNSSGNSLAVKWNDAMSFDQVLVDTQMGLKRRKRREH